MRGEEDCSVAVGFEVHSTVVALSFVMEVLDSRWGTGYRDFLNQQVTRRSRTKTLDKYDVEFPLA